MHRHHNETFSQLQDHIIHIDIIGHFLKETQLLYAITIYLEKKLIKSSTKSVDTLFKKIV